ncbi:Glycoside hydrolase family 51 protein [Mycena venus]|uniref:Glycoside hydrolase family 51 protein n=1 Tax=Mycena venus TaxID=2733690 RepID=A0A8H7CF60_9AGAR|nr:Glycoside hydrolase family 51 protein [Mycena venus]
MERTRQHIAHLCRKSSTPVSAQLPNSLSFAVAAGTTCTIGFANSCYFGINVVSGTVYTGSFFYRFPPRPPRKCPIPYLVVPVFRRDDRRFEHRRIPLEHRVETSVVFTYPYIDTGKREQPRRGV